MESTLAAVLIPLLMGCGSVDESRGLVGSGSQLVRVNEFAPANNYTFRDPDAPTEYDDWIELYNASEHVANLDGYYITDDPDHPFKHMLPPEAVIAPKGFLVLLADNQPGQGPLHLSFALSRSGEAVYLAAPNGNLVDGTAFDSTVAVPPCTSPSGQCDFVYARYPDGSGPFRWCGANGVTPGKSNGSACIDPPVPLP